MSSYNRDRESLRKGQKKQYRAGQRSLLSNYDVDGPADAEDEDFDERHGFSSSKSSKQLYQSKPHVPNTMSAYFPIPSRNVQTSGKSDGNVNIQNPPHWIREIQANERRRAQSKVIDSGAGLQVLPEVHATPNEFDRGDLGNIPPFKAPNLNLPVVNKAQDAGEGKAQPQESRKPPVPLLQDKEEGLLQGRCLDDPPQTSYRNPGSLSCNSQDPGVSRGGVEKALVKSKELSYGSHSRPPRFRAPNRESRNDTTVKEPTKLPVPLPLQRNGRSLKGGDNATNASRKDHDHPTSRLQGQEKLSKCRVGESHSKPSRPPRLRAPNRKLGLDGKTQEPHELPVLGLLLPDKVSSEARNKTGSQCLIQPILTVGQCAVDSSQVPSEIGGLESHTKPNEPSRGSRRRPPRRKAPKQDPPKVKAPESHKLPPPKRDPHEVKAPESHKPPPPKRDPSEIKAPESHKPPPPKVLPSKPYVGRKQGGCDQCDHPTGASNGEPPRHFPNRRPRQVSRKNEGQVKLVKRNELPQIGIRQKSPNLRSLVDSGSQVPESRKVPAFPLLSNEKSCGDLVQKRSAVSTKASHVANGPPKALWQSRILRRKDVGQLAQVNPKQAVLESSTSQNLVPSTRVGRNQRSRGVFKCGGSGDCSNVERSQAPLIHGGQGRGVVARRSRNRNEQNFSSRPEMADINTIKGSQQKIASTSTKTAESKSKTEAIPPLFKKPVRILSRPVPPERKATQAPTGKDTTGKPTPLFKTKIDDPHPKSVKNSRSFQRSRTNSSREDNSKSDNRLRKDRHSRPIVTLSNSSSRGNPQNHNDVDVDKEKPSTKRTKVTFRLLPPNITKEEFLNTVESVTPLPPYDYFALNTSEPFSSGNEFATCWIRFLQESDAVKVVSMCRNILFYQLPSKNPYISQADYAPSQHVFKNRKPNAKRGTLEDSKHFQDFLVKYEAELERLEALSLEKMAEEMMVKEAEAELVQAPLVEYLLCNQYDPYAKYEENICGATPNSLDIVAGGPSMSSSVFVKSS